MIRKILNKAVLLFTVIAISAPSSHADEGMWLFSMLNKNYKEMKKLGLTLSTDDIYNVNKASLKDAIVSLGFFCTAEIISPNGLMLTNHHCAFGAVQAASTPEANYLEDGFWAKSYDEEIQAEGFSASILVRMEDVTAKIKAFEAEEEDADKKGAARREMMDSIITMAEKDNHYDAQVKSMFEGNQYLLFVYEKFEDVRLVGIPPSSIGKFGGDTDNWEWPRHTGDFSMLRIYSGPDGKPAPYSEENIPYKPKHFLPINISGVKEGDYAMVMGYPGSTERYKTSHGISADVETVNPVTISVRERRLGLMMEDMEVDPVVRLKYASKYSRIANYYKYFIGVNAGLKRMGTLDEKRAQEAKFQKWIDADADRKTKYGSVVEEIGAEYEEYRKYAPHVQYFREAVFGIESMLFAYRFKSLERVLMDKEATKEDVATAVAKLQGRIQSHFKDYNKATDEKVFGALMKMYAENIEEEMLPPSVVKLHKAYRGDWDRVAKSAYMRSFFVDQNKLERFLLRPSLNRLQKDPIYKLMNNVLLHYRANIQPKMMPVYTNIDKKRKLMLEGYLEMMGKKAVYPDANSTPRLTYGSVRAYDPKDAVSYAFQTTSAGILQKEDPNNYEFKTPDGLLDMIKAGDFGRYGENGVLPINFITTNDITGGNSGSPVLNARGELIGCAFDGNWEAMTGDLVFSNSMQRCISVDIRYVLWVVDKYAGAQNIIDELKIVTKPVYRPRRR